MMCTAAGMASTGMASLPSPPKADLRKADLLASRPFVADMARLAEGLVMQVYSSSHAYYYYPTTHLHEMLRRDGIEPEGNFGLRSTRHDVSVVLYMTSCLVLGMTCVASRTCTFCSLLATVLPAAGHHLPPIYRPPTRTCTARSGTLTPHRRWPPSRPPT
eukprot:scaffold47708_cov66-Phaeocystis_antarctica.AAC.1